MTMEQSSRAALLNVVNVESLTMGDDSTFVGAGAVAMAPKNRAILTSGSSSQSPKPIKIAVEMTMETETSWMDLPCACSFFLSEIRQAEKPPWSAR